MNFTLAETYAYHTIKFCFYARHNGDQLAAERLIRLHALYTEIYRQAYADYLKTLNLHQFGEELERYEADVLSQTNTTPPFKTHVLKRQKDKPEKLQNEPASRWRTALK